MRVSDVDPRGRRRRDKEEGRTRGKLRRENGEQKSARVQCTDPSRRFSCKSDGNFENSREIIIFKHGRMSLYT